MELLFNALACSTNFDSVRRFRVNRRPRTGNGGVEASVGSHLATELSKIYQKSSLLAL